MKLQAFLHPINKKLNTASSIDKRRKIRTKHPTPLSEAVFLLLCKQKGFLNIPIGYFEPQRTNSFLPQSSFKYLPFFAFSDHLIIHSCHFRDFIKFLFIFCIDSESKPFKVSSGGLLWHLQSLPLEMPKLKKNWISE
ncbi:hypothetical protein TNCT_324371 [Trichonephila clavata]|uniref:Uncharacterized protein n=1 Tax=Trichonephila clavata TaxID=2740835 RepID=A0A8X6LX05_TRICU|nr:hypothetical protein TNCT_324371 [Trichonephila clavata]